MKQSVSSTVLQQIKSGKVRMRPRSYFTRLVAASVVASSLLSLVVAYLLSIIFIWLRIQLANGMAWGARARLAEALSSFPWWALVLAAVLIGVVVWLVRRQGTLYRYRPARVLFVILSISLALGLLIFSVKMSTSPHSGPRRSGQNSLMGQ